MSSKELIESGLIELYVLGMATREERLLVEEFAAADGAVQDELSKVNHALAAYVLATSPVKPAEHVKSRVLRRFEEANSLPPKLTKESSGRDWERYLMQNGFDAPESLDGIHFLELPSTPEYYTYAVWGRPGGSVEEEIHDDRVEYLLICSGECEMTIGGKTAEYKAGDFLEIKPGIPHSATVTGKELMLVIGQRRAA